MYRTVVYQTVWCCQADLIIIHQNRLQEAKGCSCAKLIRLLLELVGLLLGGLVRKQNDWYGYELVESVARIELEGIIKDDRFASPVQSLHDYRFHIGFKLV